MTFTPHPLTTDMLLADVIAGDAEAIHRLTALNPVFAVLLDPEHRNAMVGQIRLGEAARVAEVPFDTFCAVLQGKSAVSAAAPRAAGRCGNGRFAATGSSRLKAFPRLTSMCVRCWHRAKTRSRRSCRRRPRCRRAASWWSMRRSTRPRCAGCWPARGSPRLAARWVPVTGASAGAARNRQPSK